MSAIPDFTRIIKSKIVRIGNSQGIRIPHMLIQQLNLSNEVEMSVQDDQLVIRAARQARQSWEERFAHAGAQEKLLTDDVSPMLSEWDGTEWAW